MLTIVHCIQCCDSFEVEHGNMPELLLCSYRCAVAHAVMLRDDLKQRARDEAFWFRKAEGYAATIDDLMQERHERQQCEA